MRTRRERIEAIFSAAVELSSLEQREVYLAKTCDGDPSLRTEVEELIVAYDKAGGFLAPAEDQTAADEERQPKTGTMVLPAGEKPGDQVGRYKILQQIGEGGCGVVYVAEQQEPVRRRVALKVIKLGMDTRSVIARFEAERQALALMDHPNIAKVLDAGSTETGRPFFVMELVRGIKILDYCDQNSLSTQERLDLFIQVCQAIQHAHQKGIIHRDIKPSNILVTLHDGVPVPKVIDFGIAKATTHQRLTDKTLYTAYEQFIGTPAYMSPEQAEMSGLDIDTRTDIYSLGVLLYELLTGRTPFEAKDLLEAGLDEMRRMIREREPVRPSTRLSTMVEGELTTTAKRRHAEPPKLIHLLRGDLDWIVMKALEKDRRRRYDSATGLVTDLERHLNHEPVMARPPSAAYRLQKFARRNKLMVGAAATVAAALGLGMMATSWQWIRANRAWAREANQRHIAEEARRTAEAEKLEARMNAYGSDMNLAFLALRRNQFDRVRQLLQRHIPGPNDQELRGWEWGHLWHESKPSPHQSLPAHDGPASCVAFSPDGTWLASGGGDGEVKIWDVKSRTKVASLPQPGWVADAIFLRDGKHLLTAGSWNEEMKGAPIIRWEVGSWRPIDTVTNSFPIASLAVDSSDRFLVVVAQYGGRMEVRDLSEGNLIENLGIRSLAHASRIQPGFLPGAPILTIVDDDGIALWDLEARQRVRSIGRFSDSAFAIPLAFSAGGTELVIGGGSPTAVDLKGSQPEVSFALAGSEIRTLAVQPGGKVLAAANGDGNIVLLNTEGWTPIRTLKGNQSLAADLAFSPDGKLLASTSGTGAIKLWDTTATPNLRPRWVQPDGSIDITMSQGLASCYLFESNRFEIHAGIPKPAVTTGKLPFAPSGGIHVSPRGDLLCLSGEDRIWSIWKVNPLQRVSVLEGENIQFDVFLAMSHNGVLIAGCDTNTQERVVWRVADGRPIARLKDESGSMQWWLADSRTIMISAATGARLWDVESNTIRGFLRNRPHEGGIFSGVMSRDGSLIATIGDASIAKVWDARTLEPICTLEQGGPLGGMGWLAPFDFGPDGKRLIVVAGHSAPRIYELPGGREVGSLEVGFAPVWCKMSEDGRWLGLGGAGVGGRTLGAIYLESTPIEEMNL